MIYLIHSPEWWNGRHDRLKICCEQSCKSSSLFSGIWRLPVSGSLFLFLTYFGLWTWTLARSRSLWAGRWMNLKWPAAAAHFLTDFRSSASSSLFSGIWELPLLGKFFFFNDALCMGPTWTLVQLNDWSFCRSGTALALRLFFDNPKTTLAARFLTDFRF